MKALANFLSTFLLFSTALTSFAHVFHFVAVRLSSILLFIFYCLSFFLIPLYVPFLYPMPTRPITSSRLGRHYDCDDLLFWWCDQRPTFINVLTLGNRQPCDFWGMRKLVAISGMTGCLTLVSVLGRNVGVMGAVAVGQNWPFIYPIPTRGVFFLMKNWDVSDTLATLVLASATSMRTNAPLFWTMPFISRPYDLFFAIDNWAYWACVMD